MSAKGGKQTFVPGYGSMLGKRMMTSLPLLAIGRTPPRRMELSAFSAPETH